MSNCVQLLCFQFSKAHVCMVVCLYDACVCMYIDSFYKLNFATGRKYPTPYRLKERPYGNCPMAD